MTPDPTTGPTHVPLADLVEKSGLRRIHVLAWRDLDDVEAGGSELYVARMAERWARAGADVLVRTSQAQGRSPATSRDGYRVVRKSGRMAVFPRAVADELAHRYGRADAVVDVWNGVPFLAPLWFRGPHIAVLHHAHQSMWEQVLDPSLARVGRIVEARLAPPCYRRTPILTLSASSRDELRQQLGMGDHDIRVVPPGIDAAFTPAPDPHAARADAPLVVSVGRLATPKRVDELVRVCDRARREVPDLRLVVVGDGYERANLDHLVDALGARDWVTFAGRVADADLVALYREAWVVASASSAEGWGMTLTEAAACGTPSVATRIAGHTDAVSDGFSGLLADTPRDLTDALVSVLRDAELRERLSRGAVSHAAQFSWDEAAYQTFLPLAEQPSPRRR